MAENQFNTFTKFVRHVDNAREPVRADDINKVQKAVNTQELQSTELTTSDFLQRALFALDNSFYVNTMFIDSLENQQYINMGHSFNVIYDAKTRTLTSGDAGNKGVIITVPLASSSEIPLNDFVIMVDEHIPLGASIKYSLTSNGKDFFPVRVNDVNTPNRINPSYEAGALLDVVLRMEMNKNLSGESPKVSSWVVMYNDPILERSYGLINPDLGRFESENLGDVILIRDRLQGDKLVKVVEPDVVTTLLYNEDGTLKDVITDNGKAKITETMVYGSYVNSFGIIETVLLKVTRGTESLAESLGDDVFDENGGVA